MPTEKRPARGRRERANPAATRELVLVDALDDPAGREPEQGRTDR
jgi:hypothetical protein